MDYKKQNIQNYFLYDTPGDNLFITEYMVSAPERPLRSTFWQACTRSTVFRWTQPALQGSFA